MSIIHKIFGLIETINEWIGKVFGIGVVFMVAFVLIEVLSRYLFNSPTIWCNELTQMIFGSLAVLSGGYLLKWNGHVTVDILYGRFSDRGKAIADIVTFPFFLVFCAMMMGYGGSFAWESLVTFEHSQSPWNPPIYPLKLMIPIGAFLILFQGFLKLLRDILYLVQGGKLSAIDSTKKMEIAS